MMQQIYKISKCESGAVSTVFAVSLLTVLVAAGMTLDFSRSENQRTVLQSSLDAGLMAAAVDFSANPTMGREKVSEIAVKYFLANAQAAKFSDAKASDLIASLEGGTIKGTVTSQVPQRS